MKTNLKKAQNLNRRKFIQKSSLAGAGFMIVSRNVLGGSGFVAPSDMLNVAGIGIGGRGNGVMRDIKAGGTSNIVALCDVDQVYAAKTFAQYEKAKKYVDYRKMLETQKDIDAVAIATPDHTHAVIAMAAMQAGKHVYLEKPLTHNVYEARMLTEAANKYKLATQMGNQGASGLGTWQAVEWVQSGIIGDIFKVHCWTNRPVWPQGVATPTGDHAIPDTLDWDLWLGPAKYRKYHPDYLPFNWRGWWDFGTGALGDMACHIIDVPFRALDLGYPVAVESSVTAVYEKNFMLASYEDSLPPSTKIHFDFPARNGMPPVKLTWYDGGLMPERPEELGPDEQMGTTGGGVIFEGTKGKLMCDTYGDNPRLLPLSKMDDVTVPVPKHSWITEGHQQSWVKACMGEGKAVSNFDIAGPLTEMILMGNLSVRSFNHKVLKPGAKHGEWNPYNFPGRKKLLWNGNDMKITNFDLANSFVKRQYRDGWSLGG